MAFLGYIISNKIQDIKELPSIACKSCVSSDEIRHTRQIKYNVPTSITTQVGLVTSQVETVAVDLNCFDKLIYLCFCMKIFYLVFDSSQIVIDSFSGKR